jgi:hypothetical protein
VRILFDDIAAASSYSLGVARIVLAQKFEQARAITHQEKYFELQKF